MLKHKLDKYKFFEVIGISYKTNIKTKEMTPKSFVLLSYHYNVNSILQMLSPLS